jgi:hypothetical protein
MRETSNSDERLVGGGYDNVGSHNVDGHRRARGSGQNTLANEAADGAVVVVWITCAGNDNLAVLVAIACVFMLARGVGCVGHVLVCAASTGVMVARRMIVQPPAQHIAYGIGADQD